MANLSKGGFGRQGYCKLCSFADPDDQYEFDKRVKKDWSPRKLNEWLQSKDIVGVSRQTVYNHREHVKNPKDRMVSAVDKRIAEQGFSPAKVSTDEFLERIVAIGAAKAQASPDEVTIDQAIKAASIRSQIEKKGQNMNILVQLIGGAVPDTVEGESREI